MQDSTNHQIAMDIGAAPCFCSRAIDKIILGLHGLQMLKKDKTKGCLLWILVRTCPYLD